MNDHQDHPDWIAFHQRTRLGATERSNGRVCERTTFLLLCAVQRAGVCASISFSRSSRMERDTFAHYELSSGPPIPPDFRDRLEDCSRQFSRSLFFRAVRPPEVYHATSSCRILLDSSSNWQSLACSGLPSAKFPILTCLHGLGSKLLAFHPHWVCDRMAWLLSPQTAPSHRKKERKTIRAVLMDSCRRITTKQSTGLYFWRISKAHFWI